MTDVLHHDVEIVLIPEGSVASDDVGMIEAIRDQIYLVIDGCYFLAFFLTVKFQAYLSILREYSFDCVKSTLDLYFVDGAKGSRS